MKNEARFSFQASFLTYFLKRGDNFSGNPAKCQRSANRDADNVLRIIMSEESAAAVTRCIQSFNRLTFGAVSYTHLDVYKRQG